MGGDQIPRDHPLKAGMIEAAGPKREGIEICAELMREMAAIPGVSGVNLMTTGNPQSIRDAIVASGLRQ